MNKIKISVKNLNKSFGKKIVLQNINLDIYENECLVIMGGSGCGKTVFIKILSGLLNSDSGSKIIIDSTDINTLNEYNKLKLFDKISFAFQLNALFDSYTIWENIMFKYLFSNKYSKKEMIEIARKKLSDVDLSDYILDFYPKDISGGMQKRVAIARSLASNPEIIFFDEPTSGLDPLTSEKIAKLIKNCDQYYGKKITKISIMHDVKSALSIADRIVFLKDGVIKWIGKPSEIKTTDNTDILKFMESGM